MKSTSFRRSSFRFHDIGPWGRLHREVVQPRLTRRGRSVWDAHAAPLGPVGGSVLLATVTFTLIPLALSGSPKGEVRTPIPPISAGRKNSRCMTGRRRARSFTTHAKVRMSARDETWPILLRCKLAIVEDLAASRRGRPCQLQAYSDRHLSPLRLVQLRMSRRANRARLAASEENCRNS